MSEGDIFTIRYRGLTLRIPKGYCYQDLRPTKQEQLARRLEEKGWRQLREWVESFKEEK